MGAYSESVDVMSLPQTVGEGRPESFKTDETTSYKKPEVDVNIQTNPLALISYGSSPMSEPASPSKSTTATTTTTSNDGDFEY